MMEHRLEDDEFLVSVLCWPMGRSSASVGRRIWHVPLQGKL